MGVFNFYSCSCCSRRTPRMNATFTGGRATARSHENRSRGVVFDGTCEAACGCRVMRARHSSANSEVVSCTDDDNDDDNALQRRRHRTSRRSRRRRSGSGSRSRHQRRVAGSARRQFGNLDQHGADFGSAVNLSTSTQNPPPPPLEATCTAPHVRSEVSHLSCIARASGATPSETRPA